jgi:4-hydroxybenzoate polyprenyltransferase
VPEAIAGIAVGLGSIMSWTAVRNKIEWPAVAIFAATIFWVTAYNSIWALVDKSDDIRIGVRSSAVTFGNRTWIVLGLCLLTMLTIILAVGVGTKLALPFYISLVLAAGLFAVQVRQMKRGFLQVQAFALFRQHLWAGAIILTGIWSGIMFR